MTPPRDGEDRSLPAGGGYFNTTKFNRPVLINALKPKAVLLPGLKLIHYDEASGQKETFCYELERLLNQDPTEATSILGLAVEPAQALKCSNPDLI